MRTRFVQLLIAVILIMAGWQVPVRAQDIPINYHQNPNIEHEFSTLFWSGWDDSYFGIYSHPWDYQSEEFAHSGNKSMKIWVQPGGAWGTWVWVSYPIRGHEQKKFKASFWYRGYVVSYWNFLYRDAGMTFEDLHPSLAEFYGADTAYWGGEGQDAIKFDFGGENDYTDDWTYFEFIWDYPGTLPGWGNTAMWYANRDSAYVDDIYYGEWYDGQYSGEEPFGFLNGDFEKASLGAEWLVNIYPGGNFEASDFLSDSENKTEAGTQSLRLMDYREISEEGDTSVQDRNVTYYLPVLGSEGKPMEMSFWYKGNSTTMDMFFYDDYKVTTEAFPVPGDAELLALKTTVDTTAIEIDSTVTYDYTNVISSDTAKLIAFLAPETLGAHSFEDDAEGPWTFDWTWSGSNYWGWNDWAGQITEDEAFSGIKSLWLPGDPAWSGSEGFLHGIVDGGTYNLNFKYKGDLQLVLKMGASLGYDLATDPDNIVPEEASVNGEELVWELSSDYWKEFSWSFTVGTWLADNGSVSPDTLVFDVVGTYTTGDNGYLDDLNFVMETIPTELLASQSFDLLDGAQPLPIDWNWSDASFFGWNDWDGEIVETASYSPPSSLWLPTDPGWSGAGGTIYDVANNEGYEISFMYKGNLKFTLNIAKDLGYDVNSDPDGVVPDYATVSSDGITWELEALNGWKKFSYAWETGEWLSEENANLTFTVWDSEAGDGYVDDMKIKKSLEPSGETPMIEAIQEIYDIYAVLSVDYDTTFTIVTNTEQVIVSADSELDPLAAHFTLPSAADWTEWKLQWTNPSGDIGSNLTIMIDSKETGTPWFVSFEDPSLPEENAGWTYFDDFQYGISTSVKKTLTENKLHLYPNPAADDLWMSLQIPLASVEIYNSVGQLVKSVRDPERKISVAGLSSGMYLINVTDQRGNIYKAKFLKE